VLVDDYIKKGFIKSNAKTYKDYEGADFSPLLRHIRTLPFGSKLQNHALNDRANSEFFKYFPQKGNSLIKRDVQKQKYWINEDLLKIKIHSEFFNIAEPVCKIIEKYVHSKKKTFSSFIEECLSLEGSINKEPEKVKKFILSLIGPEKDARIFEIVSFALLKGFFSTKQVFIGNDKSSIAPVSLSLFKTGRTNANDGGIDFVLKPIGRFFQVTETLDVKKYFLDIDKIERFPISFIVKTLLSEEDIRSLLKKTAQQQYKDPKIVDKYMRSIDEIFNIHKLSNIFDFLNKEKKIPAVLNDIITHSRVEFHLDK
jgi:hypothetical protein